jgi:excisionase family DNA binding protein
MTEGSVRTRILIPEIAARLSIGRMAVYEMLERGIIPGIRVGRRWIVTRHAYERWEQTCGLQQPSVSELRSQRIQ